MTQDKRLSDEDLRTLIVYLYNHEGGSLREPRKAPDIDVTFSQIMENAKDWSRKDFKKPS